MYPVLLFDCLCLYLTLLPPLPHLLVNIAFVVVATSVLFSPFQLARALSHSLAVELAALLRLVIEIVKEM